ncbi:MAG TPA: dienelactone hydrolase family protein [Acidobacteriaceae bacterium]|nr:dienelactone hydrolase family protein [Acidobacteriaceae bacterium]
MGVWRALQAEDGHALSAYVAEPRGESIAGLVVVQEIFGVNGHIRSVVDSYAEAGFFAVAPAIFDRIERGVDLSYEGEDMQKARSIAMHLNMDNVLKDASAAIEHARTATGKKTGVIGYCLGGSVAWLAACRLRVDAAVGYYGGQIAQHAEEKPKCPVMLHFGNQDSHIPPEAVDRIVAAHPEIPIYRYEAGHGFNCDMRSAYDAPSAKLARERSLDFLKKSLA